MLWSMYLQQIKYFPTPLRSPSLRSIMITFYCRHSLFSFVSATTNSMPVRKIVPTSTTSAHPFFQTRPSNKSRCALDFPLTKIVCACLHSLVFISLTHDELTRWGSRANNDDDVDDDERKSRKFLWLYLFSNLTTIKYELLKVNSHLLYCSHLIGQLVNMTRAENTKHFPRARMDLRMFFFYPPNVCGWRKKW